MACGGGGGNQASTVSATLPATVLQLQAAPSAIESAATTSSLAAKAVDLTDAIAILKMIVGLDVNTGAAPLTAYQAYAADVDGNGKVELSDAISVLKRIVGLETATANWMFFNGTPTVADKLNPGLPATVSAAVSSTSEVSMKAVLRGDVVSSSTFTYSWALTSKPSGSSATLASATAANPSFKADVAGAYVATMTITDGSSNVATSSVTLTACNASSTSSPFSDCISITSANANVAPVANAGTNQNVTTNSTVALTGALSSDANNDSLSYAWTITSRPVTSSASLTNSTTVSPTFIADKAGNYVVSLFVNDGKVDSAAATVTITASTANIAPTANAGSAQSVVTGSVVTLNGANSSDANGDSLTYLWTITSKPSNSSASLSSSTAVNPTFTADKAGSYVVSLNVNDGFLSSSSSNITITAAINNIAPVANAGSSQNVVVGATTTLNGSGSSDANGDTITYAWSFVSKPASSSAALTNSTTVNPTFAPDASGSYVLRLVVNDGSLSSAASTVTITASSANIAPVANAGVAQSVVTGSTVTLNGTASNDANGDSLTYAWSFVSKPAGSSASLSSATAASPTFTAGTAGSYVLRLVVNDGALNSTASTVTITASNANLAPVANAGGGLNVYVGTTVTLNGTGSYDPNSDYLLYSWAFVSKPAGSSATLSGATTATPSFITDVAGSYVIALAVGDGSLVSQISTVTITASPVPVVSTVSLYLYGGANNSVYLGCLTCNQFHAESVCNSFGTYGSVFSSSSIWNQFGTYGSSFQSYSPWNSFSSSGPLIVGSNGLYYGYFTTNAFKANRTTTQSFLNILNFYSSTNNLATTRSYACGN